MKFLNFKKLLSLSLVAVMMLSLFACSSKKKAEGTYVVGICQLAEHVALDAATKGFKDELKKAFGDKVKFEEANAQGDASTCSTIINNLVSKKVDLILANATQALQSAANGTQNIPILGTSITEFGAALGIKDFSGTVGRNISGTSDLAPLDKQAEMIHDLFPNITNIGLLYCSSEANSKYQVDTIKKYLEAAGYKTAAYPFADSNDLSAVTTKAASETDLIYVPTDNKAADNTGIIDSVCSSKNIPVIAGEEGIAKGCGVATLSISYYDIGAAAGRMAVKILKGEADIKKMPVEYTDKVTKKYVKSRAEKLNVKIPDGYEAIAE